MKIPILYEDEEIVGINKPAGLVVHPGAAGERETVVSWLKTHAPQIEQEVWPDIERAGVVHRLDKDTTGCLVLAKNPTTLLKLQAQFAQKKAGKRYVALVAGALRGPSGTIETVIGRDPKHRRRMRAGALAFSVIGPARLAQSDYRVLETWTMAFKKQRVPVALVEFGIHTGRTHQIRVHAKTLGGALLGDKTYSSKASRALNRLWQVPRQMLHASNLVFTHPQTGKRIAIAAPIPDDMEALMKKVRLS